MNEFIVWDNKRKQFMGDGEVIISNYGENKIQACPNSMEYINDSTHNYYEDSRWTFHQYIGLKDINNNKIYADCSIVEFGYSVGDAVHIGYFYYDKEDLSYKIKILSSFLRNGISNKFKGQSFLFDRGMIDFKIIDTIQENKLGLIKE